MKFLNKIVLIKSASFDFQELLLDGNVHFTGDQGTGKSTIQRAILFFYNADSQKLGIKAKQDSFGEFYLAKPNSHIIYEVASENTKYMIWLHKEHNRICYRFIQAIYDKKYFVEETAKGFIALNPEDIIAKLRSQKIRVHRQITKFSDYRNILYGAISAKNKAMSEFKNYSITQSPVYQNIPKTISSIFLNSELKSDSIKNTIIQSISQNDFLEDNKTNTVDLLSLEQHLDDFKKDYHDINNYKNIKKKAEQIIKIHDDIKQLEQEKILTAGQLGSNLKAIEILDDLSKKELSKFTQIQKELTQKAEEIKQQYKKQSDSFKKTASINENNITETNKKISYYNSVQKYDLTGINTILKFVDEKDFIKEENTAKQKELKILLSKYETVENKFESLFEKLKNQTNTYKNSIETKKNELTAFELRQRELINKRFDEWKDNLFISFRKQQKELDNQKETSSGFLAKLEKQRNTIEQTNYLKSDINEIEKEISDNKKQITDNNYVLKQTETSIEKFIDKSGYENKELQNSYENTKKEIENNKNKITKRINNINEKLLSFENSFYEYLNKNYKGWQETIGKVCNEDILFSHQLSPNIQNINKLLYGVNINLEEIPNEIKSIADYNLELKELSKQEKDFRTKLETLFNEHENNKVKIEKKYNNKIKPLNKQISKLKSESQQLEIRNNKNNFKLEELENQSKKKKIEELAKIHPQIVEFEKKIRLLKKNNQEIEINYNEQIKNKKIRKNTEINELGKDTKGDQEKLVSQLSVFLEKQKEIKEQYELDKENELNGKGANTEIITKIEKTISENEDKLKIIDKLNKTVIEYKKDKKEWIDKLNDFEETMLEANSNLEKLETAHNSEKAILTGKQKNVSNKISENNKVIENIENQNKEYDDFKTNELTIEVYKEVEYYILQSEFKSDKLEIATLIKQINGLYIAVNEHTQTLQNKVSKFLSPFKEKNIFNFPEKISNNEELTTFAENLTEFVAENKYAEYKKYFTDLYAQLIKLIVGDIKRLTSKYDDIFDIVKNKMNKDLNKRNFIGVVEKVELKTEPSQNKIVQTFQEIKKFDDENHFNFGEANLFSGVDIAQTNEKALQLLTALLTNLNDSKLTEISLKDTFDLKFRVIENGKDTNWQEKLTDIGSEGTDILVKAMIYITLLNVYKTKISKKFSDFSLHCIMDEIGRIHPKNIKSLIKYANERGIVMINGSPVENNALVYRHVYDFVKTNNNKTRAIKQITID